jgi:multimeric flavodoxin WrbA
MKVVALNGSPRKGGNTEIMIREVFKPLENAGIETELIQVGGKEVRGCIACGKCAEMKNQTCVITKDGVNDIIQKLIEADGIILGSPTYFADMSSDLKAVLDRAFFVCYTNGGLYKHKVGAAVVAVRRGGSVHTFDSINHYFQISQMFIVGSTYWNMGFGLEPGDVNTDEEGMKNMTDLGESMTLLLQKLKQ